MSNFIYIVKVDSLGSNGFFTTSLFATSKLEVAKKYCEYKQLDVDRRGNLDRSYYRYESVLMDDYLVPQRWIDELRASSNPT